MKLSTVYALQLLQKSTRESFKRAYAQNKKSVVRKKKDK